MRMSAHDERASMLCLEPPIPGAVVPELVRMKSINMSSLSVRFITSTLPREPMSGASHCHSARYASEESVVTKNWTSRKRKLRIRVPAIQSNTLRSRKVTLERPPRLKFVTCVRIWLLFYAFPILKEEQEQSVV